jgi:putative ABC transport system permease protein
MEIKPILSALLRNKTGAILVSLQVALSMAILANTLHIVQVRQALSARPSGIASEADVFSMMVRELSKSTAAEQSARQKRNADALRAVGGVKAVAVVNQSPISQSGNTTSVFLSPNQTKNTTNASTYESPDSLVHTWGLKLVEGREFRPDEVQESDENVPSEGPHIIIVTKPLADKLWPGAASVVGKLMYFGTGADASEQRIIGVVERLQSQNGQVDEIGEFSTIRPIRTIGEPNMMYSIRTEPGQRERVIKEAEQAIRTASAGATPVIVRSKTVTADRKERYQADIALSWMLVTVSVLLLLITSSGIVGMASLWVQQRRKQIGVRRALGARRVDILRYFVTENLMITTAGVVGGVMLALALNQLLVSKLEMERLPIVYLVAGAIVFWALGIIAVYAPAWRAASISPATATRSA